MWSRGGLPLERSEGQGREVLWLGLQLDPISEGRSVDPTHGLFCQIIRGLAMMSPESLTQFRHHLLFLVWKRTFPALLLPSVHRRSRLEKHCLTLLFPLHPRSGLGRDFPWWLLTPRFLLDLLVEVLPSSFPSSACQQPVKAGIISMNFCDFHLLSPGWPHEPSPPSCLLLTRRQAFSPAFAPDWVTLPGSFLWHRDVRFLLSFLRVPSDVVWLLCSERVRS
ncbi:hypothetical protein PanWU01x14_111690 [Parasponia andersonii]|uniref:Uncharacterized protein n=1 Tax=Parasponia andersonii TaxID=3476 RepID=A0A2P5CYJ7_PARAD|nr:hypothetical protein PanWU01x14_111690 [Parasponia andersonii]